jgi:hypothetical protein
MVLSIGELLVAELDLERPLLKLAARREPTIAARPSVHAITTWPTV